VAQPFWLLQTNLFAAKVNLLCVSTNQSGGFVYQYIANSNLVQECASEMGISNLTGLSLVFNRSNSALEVINRTNHTLLCTVLSFGEGVSLANSNNTRVEWATFVFVGTNTTASGLLSATERLTWGTNNQLTSFGLRGRLTYTEAAEGTNSPAICRGTLLVGTAIARAVNDDHEDDCDRDDDHHNGNNPGQGNNGNNGNHGQGNNCKDKPGKGNNGKH
jgi:hypothetical protein